MVRFRDTNVSRWIHSKTKSIDSTTKCMAQMAELIDDVLENDVAPMNSDGKRKFSDETSEAIDHNLRTSSNKIKERKEVMGRMKLTMEKMEALARTKLAMAKRQLPFLSITCDWDLPSPEERMMEMMMEAMERTKLAMAKEELSILTRICENRDLPYPEEMMMKAKEQLSILSGVCEFWDRPCLSPEEMMMMEMMIRDFNSARVAQASRSGSGGNSRGGSGSGSWGRGGSWSGGSSGQMTKKAKVLASGSGSGGNSGGSLGNGSWGGGGSGDSFWGGGSSGDGFWGGGGLGGSWSGGGSGGSWSGGGSGCSWSGGGSGGSRGGGSSGGGSRGGGCSGGGGGGGGSCGRGGGSWGGGGSGGGSWGGGGGSWGGGADSSGGSADNSSIRARDLPLHIVGCIAGKVPHLGDILRFSNVCKSWNEAARTYYKQPTQVPCRVSADFPHNWFKSYDPLVVPYHLVGGVAVAPNHLVQDLNDWVVKGSGCGWLVILATLSSEIFLWNPFSRVRLPLPLLTDHDNDLFPMVEGVNCDSDADLCSFVRKVVVVHRSTAPADYIVIVLFNATARIAYAKPGEKLWSTILVDPSRYQDVAYHKGQLYALNCIGFIAIYNFTSKVGPSFNIHTSLFEGAEFPYWHRLYLVPAASELYIVVRQFTGPNTTSFLLFRIDAETCIATRVIDIGENVFFLGRTTSSMALSTRDLLWPHANSCIWYADDYPYPDKTGLTFDVGLYNVENGTLIAEPAFPHDGLQWTNPPVWITRDPW